MDETDYEAIRLKNIAERKSVFAEFFQDIKKDVKELRELKSKTVIDDNSENEPPRKRRKTVDSGELKNYRVKSVRLAFRKKYNTRSRARRSMKESNDSENEDDENLESRSNKPRLKVLFPWAKPYQRSIDLMKVVCDVDQEDEVEEEYDDDDGDDDDDDDDDDSYYNSRRKREYKVTRAPYDPDTIPSVDEITQKMLENIAEKSTLKEYCTNNGTSCHQCRQKTKDTKTVCRSGECIGVRGQFCGPCLRGRYGESALEALKDPNWACPPCRGLCNCSICRNRNGLPPTGILAPTVREEGFSSVMDYLQAAET